LHPGKTAAHRQGQRLGESRLPEPRAGPPEADARAPAGTPAPVR
jgi:hypothetical protein